MKVAGAETVIAGRLGRATRCVVIAAGAALWLHGAAFAQGVELKLGHVGEPGSLFQASAD